MSTFAVVNPATGQPFTEVVEASGEETNALIERAYEAFPAWRDVAPGERARLLRRFAAVVDEHIDELADLEVRNAGHTLGNARWEAGNVRDVLNYYSAAPERLFGRQTPVPGGVDVTFHEPLGVVGVMVPWNFPMPIAGWGFAPALSAGNTVVLKPAELTPLTAMRLAELALEAGLPEGVFTVIPGKGSVVGEQFVTNPLVRKVCFTGSTEVGKRIMAGCAEQVKRVTLELGGKSANIVFADADLAKAAVTAPYAVFDNAGQDCCARSRILVERSAYNEFLGRLEEAVTAMKVIDPGDPDSEMGPLVSARQKATVTGYLDDVEVAFAGSAPESDGFWVPPTVVLTEDVKARIWREEVFGPVVAVMPFDDEEEAIRLANDTEYGLSGSIFTRDLGRALRVSRAVEVGNLSVNSHSSVRYWTPFGGFKQSGLGRELGPDAPNAFTDREAVRRLPVAAETRNGYDRDKFKHWIDANGDCQDTRDEVLVAESTVSVSGCEISTGRWESYYDKKVWTDSADVDIDHMVPLAESWDSGAKRWDPETRERFANDLHDPRPLIAVTDNVNQSKSDQDPAEWMPQFGQCTYVRQWVAVKIRWSLEVDRAEKRSLLRYAGNCKNTFVKVNQAQIGLRRANNSAGDGAGSGGHSGGGTCTTGYTPCLPPPPPDLDCADVKAMGKAPVKVWGSDPHHLDGDNDGWGCTS